MSDVNVSVSPQASFAGINSAMWKTIVTWAFAPSGVLYNWIAVRLGLPIPDAGSVADFIVLWGPGATTFIIACLRRTEAKIVAEAAKIMVARGHDTGAAYAAQAVADMKAPTGTTLLSAHPLVTFLGLSLLGFLAAPLGGCTLTGSNGQPVVLTAKTAPGLVLAKLQAGCGFYNTNADAINKVSGAIQEAIQASQNVQGTVSTVETVAAIACSLLAPPPALPAAVAVPVDKAG